MATSFGRRSRGGSGKVLGGKNPMQGRRNILSQRQLSFVAAHIGNDTEAARAAGYKNPERSAPRLMAIPAVRQAIKEKGAFGLRRGGDRSDDAPAWPELMKNSAPESLDGYIVCSCWDLKRRFR